MLAKTVNMGWGMGNNEAPMEKRSETLTFACEEPIYLVFRLSHEPELLH